MNSPKQELFAGKPNKKPDDVILKLGSRNIELGVEGHIKPLITFPVHHFAERQLFELFPSITDHSLPDSIAKTIECNATQLQKESDIKEFRYLFHPDILVFKPSTTLVKTLEYNLKLHLIRILKTMFHKSGLTAVNLKLMLLQNTLMSTKYTQIVIQILLEHFKLRDVVILPNPSMCIAAAGVTHGIVIDFGWNFTTVEPLYDQRILENLTKITNRSGCRLHYELLETFLNMGCNINNLTFGDIEDVVCQLKSFFDYDGFVSCGHLKIPKKIIIDVIKNVLFPKPDIWSSLDLDEKSSIKLTVELIKSLPIDVRRDLTDSIILTGGITKIKGFKQHFINLLNDESNFYNTKCIVTLGSWCGASIYSNTTFKKFKRNEDLIEFRRNDSVSIIP